MIASCGVSLYSASRRSAAWMTASLHIVLSHKADLEAVQDLLHRQEVGHAIVEIDAEDDANGLVLTVLFPDDERAGVAWAGKSIGHGIADHQDIIEVDRAFEGRVIHEDFDSPDSLAGQKSRCEIGRSSDFPDGRMASFPDVRSLGDGDRRIEMLSLMGRHAAWICDLEDREVEVAGDRDVIGRAGDPWCAMSMMADCEWIEVAGLGIDEARRKDRHAGFGQAIFAGDVIVGQPVELAILGNEAAQRAGRRSVGGRYRRTAGVEPAVEGRRGSEADRAGRQGWLRLFETLVGNCVAAARAARKGRLVAARGHYF